MLPNDEGYNYSAAGNRSGSNLVTGPNNRLTSDGTYAYSYDNEGNLIQRTTLVNGQATGSTRRYIWDHRQRLVQVRNLASPSSTTILQQVDYGYDANDRLVSRTMDSNGPTTTGGLSTQLSLWDRMSDKVVMTLVDADGASASARSIRTATGSTYQPATLPAITAPAPGSASIPKLQDRYLHDPFGQAMASDHYEPASGSLPSDVTITATYWALTDNQGSVTDILDSQGRHAWHGVYDSYGNLVSQSTASTPPTAGSITTGLSVGIAGHAGGDSGVPGITYSWGYTGESRDSHTGLNYHRARWYAPTTGRFISEDPLGWPGDDQGNLYRYVSNNPMVYVDPTGYCKVNAQPVVQGPSGNFSSLLNTNMLAVNYDALAGVPGMDLSPKSYIRNTNGSSYGSSLGVQESGWFRRLSNWMGSTVQGNYNAAGNRMTSTGLWLGGQMDAYGIPGSGWVAGWGGFFGSLTQQVGGIAGGLSNPVGMYDSGVNYFSETGAAYSNARSTGDNILFSTYQAFGIGLGGLTGVRTGFEAYTDQNTVTGEYYDRSGWDRGGAFFLGASQLTGTFAGGMAVTQYGRSFLTGSTEGALSRGAALRAKYGETFAEYSGYRGQGFTPSQAKYLTKPYEGMGHHFVGRRYGLPDVLSESPLNVMKPDGISIGQFYERHFMADPYFYGTKFPNSIAGSWSGSALGLQKPGLMGRLWYGSPDALKVTAGAGAAAGGAGLYWWLSSDDK